MDDLEKLSIEHACERLVTAYCHYIDHGTATRAAELFTDDGVWNAPGVRMSGRAELEAGFALREANKQRMSRHVCTNFLCAIEDEDNATGVVYLTLYRHDGDETREVSPLDGPAAVGEYRDRFIRSVRGWRIQERTLAVSFTRDAE